MGRKPTKEEGKVPVQVFYTVEQKEKLERVAKSVGLPLASWIRVETLRKADEHIRTHKDE